MVLHYGQAIFEGMKTFKTCDNRLVVFRTDYLQRFNRSADILCIPNIDVDTVRAGLFKLLEIDKRWVPGKTGYFDLYPAVYRRNRSLCRREMFGYL